MNLRKSAKEEEPVQLHPPVEVREGTVCIARGPSVKKRGAAHVVYDDMLLPFQAATALKTSLSDRTGTPGSRSPKLDAIPACHRLYDLEAHPFGPPARQQEANKSKTKDKRGNITPPSCTLTRRERRVDTCHICRSINMRCRTWSGN